MLEEQSMTSIKGFHTTAGEKTAKPARRRFSEPQAVYDVYDEFKTDDKARGLRWPSRRTYWCYWPFQD